MKKRYLLIMLSGLFMAACASTGGGGYQKQVIERIPNVKTPDWVESTAETTETKGYYYYRGSSEGYDDLEAAKRAAAADARTRIAEYVKSEVTVDFGNALEAQKKSGSGAHLQDVFKSVVDKITLSGVTIKESYAEHILEKNHGQEEVYYRAYIKAAVSKEDVERLRANAFGETKRRVQAEKNKSAKELLEKIEQKYYQQSND